MASTPGNVCGISERQKGSGDWGSATTINMAASIAKRLGVAAPPSPPTRNAKQKSAMAVSFLNRFADAPPSPSRKSPTAPSYTPNATRPATVNQHRVLLSLTFSLPVCAGKVTENPLRRVPVRHTNNARVRFLTLSEEAALRLAIRRYCPAREPEIDLALDTGMRCGEQYSLGWQYVDLERNIITIPRSRHGEERWLPINSMARIALDALALRQRAQTRVLHQPPEDATARGKVLPRLGCQGLKPIIAPFPLPHWYAARAVAADSTAAFGRQESAISAIMTSGMHLLPAW